MPHEKFDLNPTSRITVDAIGKPGERVFYLQGKNDDRVVTLLVEKFQIQTLSLAIENLMSELREKMPDIPAASPVFNEDEMLLDPPLDPIFRVGELSLGYDPEHDLMVLIATEVPSESQDTEEEAVSEVRFWCTRSQIRAMCHWGIEIASRGRPICPQCGQPEEPEGHLCPKKNGHQH